ncbi:copper chaperone PCu(A)C [Streptomyces lincolnensis]|uniref:copper chaperone PCu(A)C n=1 Tax=Streptomyces lincolnensis TaxID=1915 RepID=UPI001E2C21F5|nr:copper chaperone PCu(A)C [Streptomyces lincolnensis]MCD7441241.1 copper chaperone PCu(A)C [Streptomyces lincolnensis]
MSSSLRRGALAAAAIAFSIASLSACAAGNSPQTLEIKPDNAATSQGDIKLQNVVIITQPDPETKGPAVISATIFNSGRTAETLDSVSVQGAGTVALKPAKGKGKLTVPAGGSVILGGKGNASAVLNELGESVENGNAQQTTFTFSRTGEVSLRAFVVPAESYFSTWGPTEIPKAPGTASPSPGTSETPGAGTAGSPSPSATPTGTGAGAATGGTTGGTGTTEGAAAGH